MSIVGRRSDDCAVSSSRPGIVIAATFFLYFLLAMWLANWNCPRCNRSFFRYAFLRSLFGARCFYCQFPKWGITDAGDMVLRPKFPFRWKVEWVESGEEKVKSER